MKTIKETKKEESIKRRIKEFNDGYATGKHDAKKEMLEKINEKIRQYRAKSIISKGLVIDKRNYREDYVLKRFAEEFEEFKKQFKESGE